jgi:hypothetical protein
MTASGRAIAADDTSESELLVLLPPGDDTLRHKRIIQGTLATYSAAVRGLDRFLATGRLPRRAGDLCRERIEASITELLARWTAATVHNRHRGLQSDGATIVVGFLIPRQPGALRVRSSPTTTIEESAPRRRPSL